jgi:hypothetical protein
MRDVTPWWIRMNSTKKKWNAADYQRHDQPLKDKGLGERYPLFGGMSTFIGPMQCLSTRGFHDVFVDPWGQLYSPQCPFGTADIIARRIRGVPGAALGNPHTAEGLRTCIQNAARLIQRKRTKTPQPLPWLHRVRRETERALLEIARNLELHGSGPERKRRSKSRLQHVLPPVPTDYPRPQKHQVKIEVGGIGGAYGVYTDDRKSQTLRVPLAWHLKVHKRGWSLINGCLVVDIVEWEARPFKNRFQSASKLRPKHVLAIRPVGRARLEGETWLAEVRFYRNATKRSRLVWLRHDDCPHGVTGFERCEPCCLERQKHTRHGRCNPDNLAQDHHVHFEAGEIRTGCPKCEEPQRRKRIDRTRRKKATPTSELARAFGKRAD